MANANAIVQKLKDVGLRHGEKAGVAIASMVFFLCIGMAAKRETINTTPAVIRQVTNLSDSNLKRNDSKDTILKRLEEKGIKDTSFATVIDDQVKTALAPDDYKPEREWVSTEPGAGLIRDTPTLIAVTELYAYPGRGGFVVYELDENGNRIPDPDKDKPKEQPQGKRRKRRVSGGGMMGGMGGGMMGGMGGQVRRKTKSKDEIERENKAEDERKQKQLDAKLAGASGPEDAKAKEEAEKDEDSKEVLRGHRWVALTGVFDHEKLVANYRAALKNPAVAHPNYARLNLERKTLQPDGTWTEWQKVSRDENLKVLDNLAYIDEEELTPETVRNEALVDPLPFLRAGLWEKVHVASLVPKEKKVAPKTVTAETGGMMSMMRGMGGMNMDYGKSMQTMPNSGAMMQSMMASRGRGGPTEAVGNYWKTDEKHVMIRAFDFTVKPDTSYRYRVQVVVFNPNRNHEFVSPGVDTKAELLRGPWSEPTDEVHMPADVMPYAIATAAPTPTSDMKARFQVVRFHPADGATVPHNFYAGPGEVIGEPRTDYVPVADGSGKKSHTIDFNSHQIVLDINANKKSNGYQLLPAGFVGPPIDRPALTLVLRHDGSVIVHNEADDISNEVRRDIWNNYAHEIQQSTKKRKSSAGTGMMGMSMGGRMMQSMPGGGMGGGMR
jgi:hypothetical protein